jgi:alcohol dehydrogenase
MVQFAFSVTTQVQFGAGVSGEAGSIVRHRIQSADAANPDGLLVVLDRGVRELPPVVKILQSLEEAGFKVHLFDQVQPNPRDEDVYAAAARIRTGQMGGVVAIGGGSSIDTAKGAALIAGCGGTIADYAGWGKVPRPLLPLVAVPTTAGSGSEVTSWAVISDSASHTKLAIGDPALAPAAALVDPCLTLSLPVGLTAATGLDALTHAIEAYLCALSSPVNDLLALEAIRLVAENLRRVVADGGDLPAREAMLLASTLGGIAINNADVAGVHCLSEGMGGVYDAPHGLLNAILLPYFMAYWQEACRERFARIAVAFGAPPQPEEAVNQVVALVQALKLPSLPEIGVRQADLPRLAALAEANVSNPSNPRPLSAADYLALLHQAMSGELPGR